MCAEKFPLVSMGGRAEGLACADPGARTPIGASGIFFIFENFNNRYKKLYTNPGWYLLTPCVWNCLLDLHLSHSALLPGPLGALLLLGVPSTLLLALGVIDCLASHLVFLNFQFLLTRKCL